MSDGGGASEREYNGLFDAVTCTARLTTNTMLQKANMDDDDAETAMPMPCGAPITPTLVLYIYVENNRRRQHIYTHKRHEGRYIRIR